MTVKPYYTFEHKGGKYLINVIEMSAFKLSEGEIKSLSFISSNDSGNVSCESLDMLEKYDLLDLNQDHDFKVEHISPFINSMPLLVTQTCNLNCIYCYGDQGEYGEKGSMSLSTAQRAIDWLIKQSGNKKILNILLFGGEPSAEFDLIKKVVEYANRKSEIAGKKVKFNMTTNATLLNDHAIDFIVKHKISILVSIDGPKDIHDRQRPFKNGRGSHDTVTFAVRKLIKSLPSTKAHAVLMDNNNPDSIKEAILKLGFESVTITPASRSLHKNNKALPVNNLRCVEGFYEALIEEASNWIKYVKNRNLDALKKLKQAGSLYSGIIALTHNVVRSHYCGAGLSEAAVSISGDIYLCHRFVGMDDYKLGNIYDEELKRNKYLESPTASSPICSQCFAMYYCAGGCKYDNLSFTGSIEHASEEFCKLKKMQVELSAYVVSNLGKEDNQYLIDNEILFTKICPLDF